MDRNVYAKWRDHPLRNLMARAAQGDTIRSDELDDLLLPPRVRRAAEQAITNVRNLRTGEAGSGNRARREADNLSSELVEALGPDHETQRERDERRAQAGDADALARIEAREKAADRMAENIMRDGSAHA